MMRMSTNLGARRTFSLLAPRNLARTPIPVHYRPSVMAFVSRGVADDVKNKTKQLVEEPGNVLKSAKDELKNVGGDLAKTIAGGVSRDLPADKGDPTSVTRELGGSSKASHGGLKDDFVSITRDIAITVPEPAMRIGLAGGIPYVGTALASVYYSRQAAQAMAGELHGVDVETTLQLLNQIQHVQVTYGAVLLGFLGAVHWGLEFAKYGGEQGYKRLALGVAPALYAWPTLALSPEVALAAQWAGFTGFWWADSKATTAGWTPKWYSQYRFYLSILVGSCIIGTLAGTNIFGPASSVKIGEGRLHKFDQAAAKGSLGGLATKGGRKEGELSAEKTEGIEALPAEEGSDGYVIIKKKDIGEGGEQDDKKVDKTNDPGTQDAQNKKDENQRKTAGSIRRDENVMSKSEKNNRGTREPLFFVDTDLQCSVRSSSIQASVAVILQQPETDTLLASAAAGIHILACRHHRNHSPQWERRAPATSAVTTTTITSLAMGGANDDSTLPSPISPTSAQGSSSQTPSGALNSTSQSHPLETRAETKTENAPARPSLNTAVTTSTVDSFASAVSTPVSARPDKPRRAPPPIPIEVASDASPEVPPKEDLPTPVSQTNGHSSYDQPGAKSTTGRAITHNLDSPDDLQTLTPLRAHYLKKTLISLQFSKELNTLTTQPSNPNISTLSYLGAPFTPLPRDVPREDLPFLRFMFRQFALTFPFLAAAPKDFFPNKLQPFIASVVARNLSSATNLLESDDEKQANDGQQMLNKAEKHLALLLGAAMKIAENEEVVRLSQADLARIEKAAERRRRKAEAASGKRPEVFDVNVIAVRAITDKGRVRSKVHEEFVIRTRRTGQPDVFVSRRYGDFKSLADELRKHHPMEEIRPPPPKDRSQVVVSSTPTNTGFSGSIRSYLYGSGSATPSSSTGAPTSPVPTNDSAETLGSLGSPTASSMQSQSLSREKNRLTLRGYLHGLLSHSSAIASSPVLRSFLLSGPIRLTDEERRDADRREEADRIREEGKKKFAEEIAARIEVLRSAVRGVRGDMMGADGLSRIFATIKATQNVNDLPTDYRAVLEWARISLASTIFQQLVAADSASETLANLKRLHGLMPYFVMKGILKVSNPMAMIRGMLDLFLATPFGGKSLLQRMFTSSLSEEVRALQEDIQAVEDKVEDPILCEKIKQFINAPPDIQKLFKADAAVENLNLISVILRSETSPTLNRPQLHRVMRANRAHAEYMRHKADLSDSDEDEGPQNEDAWLFEDLTVLLKLYARLRDREQLIALIFEGTTSELLKDIITIFYTPLAQVYKAASIADSLGDLQNFINDLIRTVEQIDELGQLNPHRTVQAFIDLVARHEQAFYAFVHKVHSKGEGLFDSLMKWIELFIGLMREGLGNSISLEFILPHAGGEEREQLIREIDSVALYHYKLKLAHEDKIRKRFGRSANANSSIEDQEEAAAQEFMADIARDMQFSDVLRGEAGEITAMESESGSSDYDSDETEETDSTEESDSGSGTGTAESVGDRAPPHSAPLAGREPTKGRASLDVPSPSKPSGHSGLRHTRSFSHEQRSPAKKDPTGGRIPLHSSPTPQRRRKTPAQVLKEPELKLLPELLPLFIELVRPTLQPRSV